MTYTSTMADFSDSDKLDAIVGAAIQALANAGADARMIGSFAAQHRQKVAELLNIPSTPTPVVDMKELVDLAVTTVTNALQERGVLRANSSPRLERLNVIVGKTRTTVSVEKPTLDKLIEMMGSKKAAKQYIEQVANNAPKGTPNRTDWVTEQLTTYIQLEDHVSDSQQRPH